jgi:hypothetical protein
LRLLRKQIATLGIVLSFLTSVAGCGREEPDAREAASVQETPAPDGFSGRAPAAVGGTPSVVTLTPRGGAAEAPPPDPIALLDQFLVRTGQTIEFANSESIAHNVHVSFVDNDSTVYLADMDPADRAQIVLERQGGYDVTCDVHPGMRAFIFVTSAPYATFAEIDGSFVIPNVPPGSYTASAWSVDPDLRSQLPVEVTGDDAPIDLSSPQ